MRNKRFGKLLSAALAAAMALSLSSAALAAGNGETHLTIIGTSDTHGNIWGYSYEDMKESTGDGLARVSAYVNQVRSENPNTILVDAGDTIQGTIMTDDLYSKDTASHPVAAALNYMDYDAWTLGNHEFNFGVDTLKSILESRGLGDVYKRQPWATMSLISVWTLSSPFWSRWTCRCWRPTSRTPTAATSPARATLSWSGAA